MSIFSFQNGITWLTVNSAAGGCNFLFSNQDLSTTTIFLTTSQVRQVGQAVATAIATNYANVTVGTITVSTPTTRAAMPWETAAPVPPINAVVISAPLSGTGSGTTFTYPLPLTFAQQLGIACNLFSVTNQ
jgi:hypothetical protein